MPKESIHLLLIGILSANVLATEGAGKPQPVPRSMRVEIARLRPTAKAYVVSQTPSGTRFFVTPPGPCSCDIETVYECVQEIEKAWTEAMKEKAAGEKVECLPNAGCSMGRTRIQVECRAARSRRKP